MYDHEKNLLGEFIRHLLFSVFIFRSVPVCRAPPIIFLGWKPAKFLHLYSGSRLCVEISRYLVDLEVVLSWVTAASILRRRDSWVSEGTKYKSRRFRTAAVVRAEQGFRLWGCLWCVSLLETSEGCMPSIHAVLPKQDINEAFSSRNRCSCLLLRSVLREL